MGDEAARAGRPTLAMSPPTGHVGSFEFGSYGRISLGSDLRGGVARPTNIVAFGPRVDLESYAEVELRREDKFESGIQTRVVATLALFPSFFHFDGRPMESIAVRNLYVQGAQDRWTVWAGSRMYRGDDIYLLNLWPLDNQNTIGAGAFYTLPSDTIVAGHVGMNRMDNPNQFQTIPQVSPLGFGATTALVLDRPRLIETLKVTQFFRNSEKKRYWSQDGAGLKAIVYGEAHQISGGVRRDFEPERQTALPSDFGFLVGGQLTYWTGKRDTFASLFVRFAQGLAAYDPLDVPTTFAFDRRTQGATEFRVALSGNWERSFFGVTWGALIRNFRDASPQATSVQKYDEGAVVVRPHFFIGENFGISIDGSYQERRYAANPMTGEPLSANMLRGALLPYWSPTGRGAFKRPQIGPMYSIASRSSGARSLYGADDPFAQRSVEHFFGVLAEWWFNFSSYP